MKENKNKEPRSPQKHSIEPGHPDYKPGHTAIPDVDVMDEDAKAEKDHEKHQPNQGTGDEQKKIVNEQEQDQVVNNDEAATETAPPKMSDKPKEG